MIFLGVRMWYGCLIFAPNFNVNNPGSRDQIHPYKGEAKTVSHSGLPRLPYKQPVSQEPNKRRNKEKFMLFYLGKSLRGCHALFSFWSCPYAYVTHVNQAFDVLFCHCRNCQFYGVILRFVQREDCCMFVSQLNITTVEFSSNWTHAWRWVCCKSLLKTIKQIILAQVLKVCRNRIGCLVD